MSSIRYCPSCGNLVPPTARFCASCGGAIDGSQSASPVTPPAPASFSPPPAPTTPVAPVGAGPSDLAASPPAVRQVPAWLLSEWPLVGVSAVITILALAIVSALYGAITAVVTSGRVDAFVSGLRVGVYLGFAAFGTAVAVVSSAGDYSGMIATSFLPLPWLGVAVAAIWLSFRFAVPQVRSGRPALIAFVVKYALVLATALTVLGALMSVGDAGVDDFTARVRTSSLFFFVLWWALLTGFAILWRRRLVRPAWLERVTSSVAWRTAAEGTLPFVVLGGVLLAVGFVAALIVTDGTTGRLGLVMALPFAGINFAFQAALVALGASVGWTDNWSDAGAFATPGDSVTHLSLFNWAFPPSGDASSAPVYLIPVLLAAPILVAIVVYRALSKRPPSGEQAVFSRAFLVAGGFALAAFLGAIFGRVVVFALSLNNDDFDKGAATLLALQPSIGGAMLMGVLWGLLGSLAGGLIWGLQRGMSFGLTRQPAPAAASVPPPPTAYPPTAESPSLRCPTCGSGIGPTAVFCTSCGTRLGS